MRVLQYGMSCITALFAIASLVGCATKQEWRSRTVYQILTDRFARTNGSTERCNDYRDYCGGSFVGIKNNLDYIQDMGFDAIWISPIVENTPGGYHGYWVKDLYKINPHFGTEQEFVELVEECHKRGIWVMVDVVANHVGMVGQDYSTIVQFNSSEYYHDYCQINYDDYKNNQWRVENCRLCDLPDLKQEHPYVRKTLLDWIQYLVTKYKLDGIRIDTIPMVPKDFWAEFAHSSGVFTIGEAFDARVEYVADYQGPLDSVLNYPLYYMMKAILTEGLSFREIRAHYDRMSRLFKDQEVLGNFLENHDNPRFLSYYNCINRWRTGLAFSIMSVGIPMVYYGSEQAYAGGGDPNNREPLWYTMSRDSTHYEFMKTVIDVRKKHKIWNEPQIERYVDDHIFAFTRGDVFVGLTNTNTEQKRTITCHPYPKGTVLCNIFYFEEDCVLVIGGKFELILVNGEPKIFVPRKFDSPSGNLRREVS